MAHRPYAVRMPPFSDPPQKPDPANWWKSLPGQAAILVIAGGAFVILLALLGIVGPNA